jgi:hypothetical protein
MCGVCSLRQEELDLYLAHIIHVDRQEFELSHHPDMESVDDFDY